jgi:MoxR-like ATPase|tara:strand:- start:3731 stop:4999 length:1269 start_codon:yes stop_codon:yes gene_type:complete
MSKAQRSVFCKVVRNENKELILVDSNGVEFLVPQLNEGGSSLYKRAVAAANNPTKYCFKVRVSGNLTEGSIEFGRVPGEKFNGAEPVGNFNKPNGGLEQYQMKSTPIPTEVVAAPLEDDFLKFIHNEAKDLKPQMLFMNELKWKYLIRNIIRGKNIMMTGPAGCGKTMAAKAAANSIEGYTMEIFNLGSTQDPRATLIGNTQFDTKKGTVFSPSPFVQAIQTPNTVIVLDEITRAHPEAHNILMSVLDAGQRYLRLDEASDSPVVKVAEGVSFIASANIGNEYTATRQLDRAIVDRFQIIEMDTLTKDEETNLLQMMYPSINISSIQSVAEITSMTRSEVKKETPQLTNALSTRTAVEIGSLLYDGFTLEDAAEITIYPLFDDAGGAQSERTYIRQFVQKFVGSTEKEDLFNVEADTLDNPF